MACFSWAGPRWNRADLHCRCSAPHDKDAALKLAECEKLVKRLNFEKAIAVEEAPSPSAGLDIAGMGKGQLFPRESQHRILITIGPM